MSLKNTSPETLDLASVTSKDLSKLTASQIRHLESLLSQESTLRNAPLGLLEFKLPTNDPVQFVSLSDMHIGSHATDIERIDDVLKKVLQTPNTYVLLLGDEIEGIAAKYMKTNVSQAQPFDKQVAQFQDKIRPLYDAGKVVLMVTEYFGHPGWSSDADGSNTWKQMLGDMTGIPLVRNNSTLQVMYPNGDVQTYQVVHDAGKKPGKEELNGLRILQKDLGTDAAMGGHFHVAAVGVENYGSGRRSVLVQGGTFKGTHPDKPQDLFGVRKAMRKAGKAPQSLLSVPSNESRDSMLQPFMDLDEGLFALAAIELLNEAERQGITTELLEDLHEKNPAPAFRKVSQLSRRDRGESPIDKHKQSLAMERMQKLERGGKKQENLWFKTPYQAPYNTLSLETELRLPMSIEPIAGLRIGSSSFQKKDFAKYIEQLAADPNRKVIWLRKLLDADAGELPNRKKLLDQLIAYMNQLSPNQNIALLFGTGIMENSWKRPTRKGLRIFPPIAPASTIALEAGLPLINNQGVIDLKIITNEGKQKSHFPITVFDRLGNRGSTSKPTGGLRSLYGEVSAKKAAYVGGHMVGSGWMSFADESNPYTERPVLIAPGHWSEWNDMGKANRGQGGDPGTAMIFVPKDNGLVVVPVDNMNYRQVLMDALTLYVGLSETQRRKILTKEHSNS